MTETESDAPTSPNGLHAAGIVGAAALLRLAALPAELYHRRHQRRYAAAVREAQQTQTLLRKQFGHQDASTLGQTYRTLRQVALTRRGSSTLRALLPWGRLASVPLFLGAAWTLRRLCQAGQVSGGVPGTWIVDLLDPDPLYVLPVVNVAWLLWNIERSGPAATSAPPPPATVIAAANPLERWLQWTQMPRFQDGLKVALQGSLLLVAPGVLTLPSALTLFWFSNTAWMALQRRLLRRWDAAATWRERTAPDMSTAGGAGLQRDLQVAWLRAQDDLQLAQQTIAAVLGNRPPAPSVLPAVRRELDALRASGRLQLPLRVELREDASGRYIAVELDPMVRPRPPHA
ncbi:hypothetical protein CDCA_CDCA15G4010 [Cyanidium caldarium]|uniref:Membrane protein insertase YidC n=1 Tax=Cyanidium caldarium TaxID=2771 RepID=A0AAV9J0W4_CYACA|nr:hypothetical protein CDCA_CDCA15G4010 [Cyanidium caldarium]